MLTNEQKLASQVDSLSKYEVYDHRTREFVKDYLGCAKEPSRNAAHELLLVKSQSLPPVQHIIAASVIVLRYRLLDILADVVGMPHHPSLHQIAKQERPKETTERLTSVTDTFPYTMTTCLRIPLTRFSPNYKTGMELSQISAIYTTQVQAFLVIFSCPTPQATNREHFMLAYSQSAVHISIRQGGCLTRSCLTSNFLSSQYGGLKLYTTFFSLQANVSDISLNAGFPRLPKGSGGIAGGILRV
jgi:hypothetical protein